MHLGKPSATKTLVGAITTNSFSCHNGMVGNMIKVIQHKHVSHNTNGHSCRGGLHIFDPFLLFTFTFTSNLENNCQTEVDIVQIICLDALASHDFRLSVTDWLTDRYFFRSSINPINSVNIVNKVMQQPELCIQSNPTTHPLTYLFVRLSQIDFTCSFKWM